MKFHHPFAPKSQLVSSPTTHFQSVISTETESASKSSGATGYHEPLPVDYTR